MFVGRVNNAFNEYASNSWFVDGDQNTTSHGRYGYGMRQAVIEFDEIIAGLERDENGLITETIKIVSHSKGSLAANGYIAGLREKIEENRELFADADNVIESHIMLAPHQSWTIDVPETSTLTVAIDHLGDPLSDDDAEGDVVNITAGNSFLEDFGNVKRQSLETFAGEAVQVAQQLYQNSNWKTEDKYEGLDGLLDNQTDIKLPEDEE